MTSQLPSLDQMSTIRRALEPWFLPEPKFHDLARRLGNHDLPTSDFLQILKLEVHQASEKARFGRLEVRLVALFSHGNLFDMLSSPHRLNPLGWQNLLLLRRVYPDINPNLFSCVDPIRSWVDHWGICQQSEPLSGHMAIVLWHIITAAFHVLIAEDTVTGQFVPKSQDISEK